MTRLARSFPLAQSFTSYTVVGSIACELFVCVSAKRCGIWKKVGNMRHEHACVRTLTLQVLVCSILRMCLATDICKHMYACMQVCVYILHIHIHTHIYMYVCMYVCVCIFSIYIYIYTNLKTCVHIHTYVIHTYMHLSM